MRLLDQVGKIEGACQGKELLKIEILCELLVMLQWNILQ